MAMICPRCGFPYDGINPYCVACGTPFPIASSATVSIQTRPNNNKKKKGVKIRLGLPGTLVKKLVVGILVLLGIGGSLAGGDDSDDNYSSEDNQYVYEESYNDSFNSEKEYIEIDSFQLSMIKDALIQKLTEDETNRTDFQFDDIKFYISELNEPSVDYKVTFYENGELQEGEGFASFTIDADGWNVDSWMYVGGPL